MGEGVDQFERGLGCVYDGVKYVVSGDMTCGEGREQETVTASIVLVEAAVDQRRRFREGCY